MRQSRVALIGVIAGMILLRVVTTFFPTVIANQNIEPSQTPTAEPTPTILPTPTNCPTPTVTPVPDQNVWVCDCPEDDMWWLETPRDYERIVLITMDYADEVITFYVGLRDGEWVLIKYSFG